MESNNQFEKDKKFWEKQFNKLPQTISFRNSDKISSKTNKHIYKINKSTFKQIDNLCIEYNIPHYIFLFCIFNVYFRNLFNSNHFIVGILQSNPQTQTGEKTNNTISPFIVKIHNSTSFIDFCQKTFTKQNSIARHTHFPYSEIVNLVKSKYNFFSPLYDIVFSNTILHSSNELQTYSLKISIIEEENTLSIHYTFLTDIFSISDIKLMNEHIVDLISTILDNRYSILKNLQITDKTEKRVLLKAVEDKDLYTKGHSNRVSAYSVLIGKHLNLSQSNLNTLEVGGLFHDIGKIGVPDNILFKDSKLTDEEYSEIKGHASLGAHLISSEPIFKDVLPIVKYHHEKYDGTGYPNRLSGNEIPYFARIAAIADSFDAMTSKRTYSNGMPIEAVISEFKKCKGTHFDPELVDVMLDILENHYDEIRDIQDKYK